MTIHIFQHIFSFSNKVHKLISKQWFLNSIFENCKKNSSIYYIKTLFKLINDKLHTKATKQEYKFMESLFVKQIYSVIPWELLFHLNFIK